MVSNTTEELRARYDYGRDNIVSPCAQRPISDTDKKRLSARKLTVKAGVGVRVCKIKAYRDDTLYDVIYIATQPCDERKIIWMKNTMHMHVIKWKQRFGQII